MMLLLLLVPCGSLTRGEDGYMVLSPLLYEITRMVDVRLCIHIVYICVC